MKSTRPTASEFWNHIFPAQEPVVFRGAGGDVPMVELGRRGTDAVLDELVVRAGSRVVQAARTDPSAAGRIGYSADRWADWIPVRTTLTSFVRDLREAAAHPSGPGLYMQSAPVRAALPELAPLMPLWWSEGHPLVAADLQLWIGSGGQRVAIHQDTSHGLLFMVAGEKELLVFPPDEQENLYPAPRKTISGEPWRSRVDPSDRDQSAFPRFARAMERSRRIRIGPGDVLFMPARWWHGVDSEGLNVMFNYRFDDVGMHQMEAADACVAHAVLAARRVDPKDRDDLRRRLRSSAFSGGSLSSSERRMWARSLRCSRFVGSRAADATTDELIHRQHVVATLDAEGAHLGTGDGACTLAWDYLPLLRGFASPCAPAIALRALREEFEVDGASFHSCVAALVEAGVLVPARPRTVLFPNDLADSAIAHAVLALDGLPAHHREAVWQTIDQLGFASEDPYPGIDREGQGLFARPLSVEAARELESIARRHARVAGNQSRVREDYWDCRYRVEHRRQGVLTADGLVFRDTPTAVGCTLAWEHLEVLAGFSDGDTPTRVYAACRQDWNTSAGAFGELVAAWIEAGLLVFVGLAAEEQPM